MDLPIEPHHDLIEITDESNDDQDVRLEDFMTAEELNAVFGNSPEYVHRRSHTTSDPPQMDATGAPIVISYKSCLKDVLAVFPDICHDHVKKLYDEHRSVEAVARGISLTEDLISKVLDEKKYPKERDRLNELKRKRMSELNSDDERAAKWKNAERMNGDPIYSNQA